MNDWEKFTETLNMEDITDLDYSYAKTVCKNFKIKNLGKEHDLHVQSDALLLVLYLRTFEMCLEIYEVDPANFFLSAGFSFTNIHESQDCQGRRRAFLYLPITTSTHFTDT